MDNLSHSTALVAFLMLAALAATQGGAPLLLSVLWALFVFALFMILGRYLGHRYLPHLQLSLLTEALLGMIMPSIFGLVLCLLGIGLWPILVMLCAFGLWQLPLIYLGRWPRLDGLGRLALFALVVLAFLDVLGQPQGTDELYYHLPLAKHFWQEGSLLGGELRPNGSRPQLLHILYALVWSFGGHSAVGCFQLLMGGLLSAEVLEKAAQYHKGSGVLAAILLAGSYSWILGLGQVGSDIPVAAVLWSAFWLGSVPCALVFLALALSWKYTAVALVGVIAVLRVKTAHQFGLGVVAAVVCFVLSALFNLTQGLHPLFPYQGWLIEMPFQLLSRYGMGREWHDFLALPYRMVFEAEPSGLRFLGRLNGLWLALVPSLLGLRRHPQLAIISIVGLVFWAIGPQLLRHFLLVMPFAALYVAVTLGRYAVLRWGALIIGLYGLPINWAVLLSDDGPHGIRAQRDPCRTALIQANSTLPEKAKVALMYCWSGYLLERPYVLSSVEDHIPTRHWLLQHRSAALRQLQREADVDFVVVGPSPFGKKPYSGVSATEWQQSYLQPEEHLEAALIQDGQLVFQAGKARVYRIREKEQSVY